MVVHLVTGGRAWGLGGAGGGGGGGGGAQDEEVSPSGQTIIKVNSKKQTQPCLKCLFTVSHLNPNAQTRILSAERGRRRR